MVVGPHLLQRSKSQDCSEFTMSRYSWLLAHTVEGVIWKAADDHADTVQIQVAENTDFFHHDIKAL